MWKKIKPYVISVLLAFIVGGLAAWLTNDSMNIYESINKPELSPKGFVFPIVWSILYTLMGISAAIVYKKGGMRSKPALIVYAIQLIVNFFWTIIFFNLQAFLFSFIWLILLWILIIYMIYKFYEISPLAAYLQIPYLLWVTFAAYLNYMIFTLN